MMRLLVVLSLVLPLFAQAPLVRLINITRAGDDFLIGDRFEIMITGAFKQAISVRTTMNGRTDWGPIIDFTDRNGRWSTTGKFERADFGDWSEVWTVGGRLANPIVHFSVKAPCLKEGNTMAIVMNRQTSLTCDTAAGRQTFVTQSDSAPFRTPDGRLIPARVRTGLTAEQFQEERMRYVITMGLGKNVGSSNRSAAHHPGDAAAALITKIIGPNALSEDEILNVLSVIRGAFKRPEVIPGSELNPSTTLLLLNTLSSSNDQEGLQRQIAETIAYVRTQTSH
jgi:hypothetical protein